MKFRKQKYSDCRLISAINARIFLGKKDISDELFESLVDLTAGRNGACINVHRAYQFLGITYIDGPVGWKGSDDNFSIEWVKNHLPVEVGTLESKKGFHCSLITKVSGYKLKLVNHYKKWFTLKEMESMFPPCNYQRICRSFGLDQICVKT